MNNNNELGRVPLTRANRRRRGAYSRKIPRLAIQQLIAVRKDCMQQAHEELEMLIDDYIDTRIFGGDAILDTDEAEDELQGAALMYQMERAIRSGEVIRVRTLFRQLAEGPMDQLVSMAPTLCKKYKLEVNRGDE